LNFDWRIGTIYNFLNFIDRGDWVLKFRISVVTPYYTGANSGFSGSALYFTAGIGGIGRSISKNE
jgi:hypothetical protein